MNRKKVIEKHCFSNVLEGTSTHLQDIIKNEKKSKSIENNRNVGGMFDCDSSEAADYHQSKILKKGRLEYSLIKNIFISFEYP
jgi:hypothetical protein